jgi:hypothetical protein
VTGTSAFVSSIPQPHPPHGLTAPSGQALLVIEASRSLSHTTQITVGMTPLDEGSAHRRDLYLITQNTQKRQTHAPRWDSNPQPPASEQPQTHALSGAAADIGLSRGITI